MSNLFSEIHIPNQKLLHNSPPFPAILSPAATWSPTLLDFTSAIESQKPPWRRLGSRNTLTSAAPPPGRKSSVSTANESPPDQKIPFHHELAHVPEFPTKLFFFCEVEPASGGETPMVLSHVVYERMKEKYPEFVGRLEDEGLLANRVLTEEDDPSSAIGRGWKSTFSTHDKHVASERASKLGMKLEWIGDGSMVRTVIGPNPAIKHDRSRNRKVWFNGMVAGYTAFGDKRNDPTKSVAFGNGDPLPSDVVYGCLRIMEEESVAIPWQKGDVLLIDNWAVLHARKLFTPPRRILAALCK
ncbi:unnamed protein product [Linum trigynum]|uniref:TauD/TfdA-like domain-containing protein n=1 Tax=Linum trigynum TaxID=586398 RepID=A0AAV2EM21_9ROSI